TDVKLPNISFQIAGVYHVCGAVAVQIGGPHLAQPVPSAGVHSDLADKPTGFRITDKQCRAASGAIITISINRQQPSIITAPDQRSAQDIARVPLDFTNSVTLESFVPTDDLARRVSIRVRDIQPEQAFAAPPQACNQDVPVNVPAQRAGGDVNASIDKKAVLVVLAA